MGIVDSAEGAFSGVGAGYGEQLSGLGSVLTGDLSGGVSQIESGVSNAFNAEATGASGVASGVTDLIPLWVKIAAPFALGLLLWGALGTAKRSIGLG